ncbi:MAG: PEGA domain-containing protein [Calditrichaeota bacterium]|nr:PEGA domain-containing protein [Calditrichota bacterium]
MDSKRTALWWGIVFAIFWGLSCSKAPLPTQTNEGNIEKQNNVGKIIITAIDLNGDALDSANVYWDGKFIGLTPLEKNDVVTGTHTVRVQKTGFELYSEFITINSTETSFIEAILKKLALNKGQLFVTVDQDSVVTTVTDADNNVVDLFFDQVRSLVLDPGGYFIKAERPGYRIFHVAVEIRIDSIVIQNIHLEKLENSELPEVVLALPDSGQVNVPVAIAWESSRAERLDIDYVPNPGLSGKREIVFQLSGMKYIRATAYNNAGSVTSLDSIFIADPVNDPGTPPTIDVSVQPKNIQAGESATIRWQSHNAVNVSVDFVVGAGLSGAWQVKFDTPGVYPIEARATGPGGEATATDTLFVNPNNLPDLPNIEEFELTPDSIQSGQNAVLHWQVSGQGARVIIDQGIGEVGLSGNQNVSPEISTLYTVYATNSAGTVSRSAFLKVGQRDPITTDPPIIQNFTVEPDSIEQGQTATLRWSVSGENLHVIIDQGIGEATPEGQINVSPDVSTQFTLYATNPGGTVSRKVQLVVAEKQPSPPDPPTISLTANPLEVLVNEPITLTWTSENANVVMIDFTPQAGLNGEYQLTFSQPGEYVIHAVAYGDGGSAQAQVTVTVRDFDAPNLDFSATPAEVDFGDPVVVTWQSDGFQVIIDQGIGVRGPSGSEEIIFESPGYKIFTATAYGAGEKTTIKTDTVFVREPQSPELPVVWLAIVDSVEVGKPAAVEWHSQHAERVDVDFVQNPGLNGRAEVVFASAGRRIVSATAYNSAGQVTVSDTIEVVESNIYQQMLPIYVSSQTTVAAIHPTVPQVVENAGQTEIIKAGYYRITAAVWYNSGDLQKNESFFIVLHDENGNNIYPEDPNAGIYKVVPDDPGKAHVSERNAGLFYLNQGEITISLHHYYTIAQQFPQFVVDGPIDGPESVHVVSFKLEYWQP